MGRFFFICVIQLFKFFPLLNVGIGFSWAQSIEREPYNLQTETKEGDKVEPTSLAVSSPSKVSALKGDRTALQGLDKITGRVFAVEAPHHQPIEFGSLRIVVRTCAKAPPEEQPESAAFLEITEVKGGEQERLLFSGWMFASTPAVSSLEHPIYDVWVTDCKVEPASSLSQPLLSGEN